jgi:hypothetical protein
MLTQKRFNRMARHEKTAAYFNHDSNTAPNARGQRGPTTRAQSAFHNDWRQAFYDFELSLPAKN